MDHSLKSAIVDALPDISNLALVLVGVVMSLPKLAEKIEDHKLSRYLAIFLCLLLGVAGFVAGATQRRHATSQMETLVTDQSNLIKNTNTTLLNTNSLMATVGLLVSQIQTFDVKIKAAKGNPELIASLQAQARIESEKRTRDVQLAVIPPLALSMKEFAMRWYSELDIVKMDAMVREQKEKTSSAAEQIESEKRAAQSQINQDYSERIRPVLAVVDDLRQQLLQSIPPQYQTIEDKREAETFAKALANQPISWNELLNAGDYLSQFPKRISSSH